MSNENGYLGYMYMYNVVQLRPRPARLVKAFVVVSKHTNKSCDTQKVESSRI